MVNAFLIQKASGLVFYVITYQKLAFQRIASYCTVQIE